MNELDIQSSLHKLHVHSGTSIVLAVLGAGLLAFSVYYSASRLTPLESEIAEKRKVIARLQAEEADRVARIKELQATYERLKANTEALYAVRVTPSDRVYEVKATAIATGRTLSQQRPEYRFTLLINSPPAVLAEIEQVTYRMNHPTFTQKDYVSSDRSSQFSTSYIGWGCLTLVTVSVKLVSGDIQTSNFNMCKSLGPQWG